MNTVASASAGNVLMYIFMRMYVMAVLLAIGILFGLLCTAKFLLLCICDVRMNDDFCELLAG